MKETYAILHRVKPNVADRLRDWCVDWSGAPMDGGEQPRIVPRVRDLREAVERIEQLTAALQHIATAEPAAAGSAKPMSFKELARLIASTAVTVGQQGDE